MSQVAEVEEDLKGLYAQRDTLQEEKSKLASELATASTACKEATTQAPVDRDVL